MAGGFNCDPSMMRGDTTNANVVLGACPYPRRSACQVVSGMLLGEGAVPPGNVTPHTAPTAPVKPSAPVSTTPTLTIPAGVWVALGVAVVTSSLQVKRRSSM